ncbi:hypothetical protein PR002_g8756 [Phytophthora rubi]|uniref:Uncharacterized protein n=1 Tax=Phytophthora rubi TaxID=129364 RepID=A0A6A3MKL9_9STRA|nr:hypothetical protein PR002_g8756 [Phytophthora rubi]
MTAMMSAITVPMVAANAMPALSLSVGMRHTGMTMSAMKMIQNVWLNESGNSTSSRVLPSTRKAHGDRRHTPICESVVKKKRPHFPRAHSPRSPYVLTTTATRATLGTA